MSRCRPTVALAVAVALAAGCGRNQGAGQAQAPPPAPQPGVQGVEAVAAPPEMTVESTREVVALLQDNKDRCLGVARHGLALLESATAESSGEAAGKLAFKHRLLEEEAQALAEARAVSGEIDKRIRQVRSEVSGQIVGTLNAMHRAQQRICSEALADRAFPADYRSKISDAVLDFDRAAADLDPGFRPTPEQRQKVRDELSDVLRTARLEGADHADIFSDAASWDIDVDEARELSPEEYARQKKEWEAHQKKLERRREQREQARRDAQRSWRPERETADMPRVSYGEDSADRPAASGLPTPPPEADPQRVKTWYRVYASGVHPFKQALGSYLADRDGAQAARKPACEAVAATAGNALGDEALLDSPDDQVEEALRAAFGSFRAAALACLSGRADDERRSFEAGNRSLALAAKRLDPYGLRP
jgi:hypothetical protein